MDDADISAPRVEAEIAAVIEATRADIPKGYPGVCEWCEEHKPRLIRGACAPCRDENGLE